MSEADAKWPHGVTAVALSDVGMRRSQNQDAHKMMLATSEEQWQKRGHFLMVADGMGAHAAGELASKLAVDNIPHLYCKHGVSPPEALQKAIIETNLEIYNRGQANADFHQMGTTASCLTLLPQGALIGHVGDSRIYRYRGETLHQLTFDHSLVWELRAANQIPDGDDGHNIPKNVITRSLGPNPHVQVDVEGPLPVEEGDVFLLCSDGLTGPVEDDELAAILSFMPPREAAQTLVDLANLRGGPDNTTVVIAKVDAPHVATANTQASPISIGRQEAPPPSPAIWVGPIVCALVALVLFLTDQTPLAIALLVIGIAGLLYVLLQNATGNKGIQLDARRRLGKGPYVEVDMPNSKAGKQVAGIVDALRDRAMQIGWELDWTEMDRHCEAAQADPSTAPQHYCRAIHSMMAELRSFLARQASDSAVEL